MLNFSHDNFGIVSVYFRSRIVELRPKQTFGDVSEFFCNHNVQMQPKQFLEVSHFIFETIILFCSWDKFWKGLSFRTNKVEVQLRNFFHRSEKNFDSKLLKSRQGNSWKWLKLLGCKNVELQLGQSWKFVGIFRRNEGDLRLRQVLERL